MPDVVLAFLVELAVNDSFRSEYVVASRSERREMLGRLGDVLALPAGFVDLLTSDNAEDRRAAFESYVGENVQISSVENEKSMLRALKAFVKIGDVGKKRQ
jgi:hypothetical protein